MGRTGYYAHPDCKKHNMGTGHPECAERINAIEDRLLISGVADALDRREPTPAAMGELLLAHGRRHVAALRGLNDILLEEVQAGGPDHYSLDPDTVMNTWTLRAALLSAGAAIDAVDAVMAGELAQLRAAEALDAAPQLGGDALLAAFYLNELVLRLAPRQDPLPELDAAYARTRERLRAGEPLAWTLRRFERDLLAALGVGFELDCDGDGEPLDPAARYRLDPEHGPSRLRSDRGHGERNAAATGSALLALGADRQPLAADLASLRLPLRVVLAHHLGSRGLKSWEMAASLGRWNRQG